MLKIRAPRLSSNSSSTNLNRRFAGRAVALSSNTPSSVTTSDPEESSSPTDSLIVR